MSVESLDLPRAVKSHVGCGEVRSSKRGRWRAWVLIGVHVAAALHIAHWKMSGSSLSPLEPSEAGDTLVTGMVNAGFVLFALLILSTLVLGRWFCGWGCHLVALQDACTWMLAKLKLEPKPIRSRVLAFVPLFAAFDMFFLPMILRRWQGGSMPTWAMHLSTSEFWMRFPGPAITVLTFLVCGFAIVWILGNKGFCTYACPYGAFFGVADRVAPGRIRVTDACEGCGHCTVACTSNVRVHEEVLKFGQVVDSGCMKCLDCIDVCPKDALYFGFGALPRSAVSASGKKRKRRFDFSVAEEVVLGVVFLIAVYAYRGLNARIPYLLALALAVMAGVAVVSLARMIRARDFTFQHAVVRREDQWTGRGLAVVSALVLFIALTAHSTWVRFNERQGDSIVLAAGPLSFSDPARRAEFQRALPYLETARDHGLFTPPELSFILGQVYQETGDPERALVALEDAVDRGVRISRAYVYLARMRLGEQRVDEAVELLWDAYELDAGDAYVPRLVESIVRNVPGHVRGQALFRALSGEPR